MPPQITPSDNKIKTPFYTASQSWRARRLGSLNVSASKPRRTAWARMFSPKINPLWCTFFFPMKTIWNWTLYKQETASLSLWVPRICCTQYLSLSMVHTCVKEELHSEKIITTHFILLPLIYRSFFPQ